MPLNIWAKKLSMHIGLRKNQQSLDEYRQMKAQEKVDVFNERGKDIRASTEVAD